MISIFIHTKLHLQAPRRARVCLWECVRVRLCACVCEAHRRGCFCSNSKGFDFLSLLPRCCSQLHPSFVTISSEGFWGQLWRSRRFYPIRRLIREQSCRALCKRDHFFFFFSLSDAGISFQDAVVSLSRPMNKFGGGKKRPRRNINEGITGLATPPKFLNI